MKYLVVSDIHGSGFYASKISEIFKRESPDMLILLGDLYYHGPRNPLTRGYDPMKVANIFNSLKDKILCVRGNCDAEVDQMISEFEMQDFIKIDIGKKRFLFTHGHKYNIDNIPEGVDVLVHGHFHTGFIKEKGNVIVVNAGSISLPKENTANSYVIIDDDMIALKDIDGNIIDKVNL